MHVVGSRERGHREHAGEAGSGQAGGGSCITLGGAVTH